MKAASIFIIACVVGMCSLSYGMEDMPCSQEKSISSKKLEVKEDEFDKRFDEFINSHIQFKLKFDDKMCELLQSHPELATGTNGVYIEIKKEDSDYDRSVGILKTILEWRSSFVATTKMCISEYERQGYLSRSELFERNPKAFCAYAILSDLIVYKYSAPEIRANANFVYNDLAYSFSQVLKENLPKIMSSWLKGDKRANLDLLMLYLTTPKTTFSFAEDLLLKNPKITAYLLDIACHQEYDPNDLWKRLAKECNGFFTLNGIYARLFMKLNGMEKDQKSKITAFIKNGIKDFLRNEGFMLQKTDKVIH